MRAERDLAIARGEVCAESIDFPVTPDMGAPLPLLFRSDYRCFLTFYCADSHDVAQVEWLSAIVEFDGCFSAKLGSPNEDGFAAHPLCGRGGDPGSVQRVLNSPWLREVKDIDGGHSQADNATAHELTHFIFWFHDSTFECLAQSFRVEVVRTPRAEIVARLSNRLLE